MPSEADTCRTYIVPKLHAASWSDELICEQLVMTPGRIIPMGEQKYSRQRGLRPDYVLYIRKNIPIAVVEAKAAFESPSRGLQQAMQYAEMLGVKFAYSSNGHGIVEHDYITGIERDLTSFPTPHELWARLKNDLQLERERDSIDALTSYWEEVGAKTPRYYQQVAINRAVQAVIKGQKRILLTMATGTGKTFVAFQIAWRLWKSGRKKRILYLSDRNVLIDQAKDRTFSPLGQALHKIQRRAVKSREVYFALYQALSSPGEGPDLYKQYKPDFFDLIFIDECHRGSARDESSWRKILEYFEPAQQIGMTATPRRDDNADTYEYFGNPIYTYSLKQGIEDGFLAPYRVMRVSMDVDTYGLQIDQGIIDRFGKTVPPGLYGTHEFERMIVLLQRTEAVARHLTQYMQTSGIMDKTIVFCVDQEHALDMRNALARENPHQMRKHPDYVARVVSDEGAEGRNHLDHFSDPERKTPVILTTSEMLTTGVDAPTCRNIVLFKPIASMTDFKQIIGRGTRVAEDFNKFWFTILDYTGATRLFYDPAFDGEPVTVSQTVIDSNGQETSTRTDEPPSGEKPPREEENEEGDQNTGEFRRKYYLDNVIVYVVGEQLFELDPADNILRTMQYTDYVRDRIRQITLSAGGLRDEWSKQRQRDEIREELRKRGIDLDHLATLTHHQDADPLDILLFVAFDQPVVSRKERVAKLKQKKTNFFNKFTPNAREILDILLEKYADYGINELEKLTSTLSVPPFTTLGTPLEITERFGTPAKMREVVNQMLEYLYEA